MISLRKISIIVASLALISCHRPAPFELPEREQCVSIAYLKSLCRGEIFDILTDTYISGTVVANDWLGEYARSIVVVDETGGIEIHINSDELYRKIPIYARVTVVCNGMTLGRIGGKIALGAHPSGEFPIDGIDQSLIGHYIRIDSDKGDEVLARDRTIGSLTISDISSYVCIRDVHIVGDTGSGMWCEAGSTAWITTDRHIADDNGNVLRVRTRGGCLYAGDRMPEGKFTIRGIVDYASGEYFLRPINYGIYQ